MYNIDLNGFLLFFFWMAMNLGRMNVKQFHSPYYCYYVFDKKRMLEDKMREEYDFIIKIYDTRQDLEQYKVNSLECHTCA